MKVEHSGPGKKGIIRGIGVLAILAFILYLPILWWEISWIDLFNIVTNNTKEIQLSNDLTKILQGLGVIDKNLHSWAFERIMICLAIGIGMIILLFLLTKNVKNKTVEKEIKNEQSN